MGYMDPVVNGLRRLLPGSQRKRLADYAPWLLPIDDEQEIMMTRAGGLLLVVYVEPADLETASRRAMVAHQAQLSAAMARLGGGWTCKIDQWRTEAPGYLPECDFGGVWAAQEIDRSQRELFSSDRVFSNDVFLSFHFTPRAKDAFKNWFADREDPTAEAHITFFKKATASILEELLPLTRGLTRLRGDPLASYLDATGSYDPRSVQMPVGHVASQLATYHWDTASGLTIDGKRHVATTEVWNFGSPSPLTMEPIHELPWPCRWVTTFHGLDPDERPAHILETRKRWAMKQRPFGTVMLQAFSKNPHLGRLNPEATRNIEQLDEMLGELARRPFAEATCNVHVWADSRAVAHERASHVASLLKLQGLNAAVADMNEIICPLDDMPGNVTADVRNSRAAENRVEMGQITRLSPLTGFALGAREDRRFGGPALMMLQTRRGLPFLFAANAPGSDKAHTLFTGVTGVGKSTVGGFMASQFLRYLRSRVVVIDRYRSFRIPCLCHGGDWKELGGGKPSVQPLRYLDRPGSFKWAHGWVMHALRAQGMEIKPNTAPAVTRALRQVAKLPPDERTLSALYELMAGDARASRALEYYLRGGPCGETYDGVVPGYGTSRMVGIETTDITEGLADDGSNDDNAALILAALFHALEHDRLTGDDPKFVFCDEAGLVRRNRFFAAQIDKWARELRKKKAMLVLATQSLHDFMGEETQVIFAQMGNYIYGAHTEATRPVNAKLYDKAGLTEEQIALVAGAQPKAEYLFQTQQQITRMARIELHGAARSICGASSPRDHLRADALLAAGHRPGEDFARAWLAESTDAWWERQELKEVA